MRNITFANKDFAAVNSMGKEERDSINAMCAKKIKELKLTPERNKHSIKFKPEDLYVFSKDSNGKTVKTAISHTVSIADIMRFINNVEVIPKDKVSEQACETLCKLYVLTR